MEASIGDVIGWDGIGGRRIAVPDACQRVVGRKGEAKRRPFPRSGLYPDSPAVPVDDALGDGQADAGSFRIATVQASKDAEDLLLMARFDADTVVGDPEKPVRLVPAHLQVRLPASGPDGGTLWHCR